ncbi:tumor necrosis factor receptor superfamily member 23-like [Ptychodera flava]|uniref:tumor necrosis factor receptor superfamily member 23-like n=1 Tax=Ptychodera flava TaxID=63121 RepID=UPI003969C2B3
MRMCAIMWIPFMAFQSTYHIKRLRKKLQSSDKQMLTLLCALSVFHLALTTTTEENTALCRTGQKYNYEHLQYGDFCCRSCHAGFNMKRPCIAGRPETTECARCRYGTYTEGPNLLRHCFNQPQCDDGRRQIKRPGSIANRQECECKDGFYESPSGELCLPWTVCGVGYGVATPGSVTRDVCVKSVQLVHTPTRRT